MPKQYVHVELRGFYDVVSIMAPSSGATGYEPSKETLDGNTTRSFLSLAQGIPSKYIKTQYQSYSCWLIYPNTSMMLFI